MLVDYDEGKCYFKEYTTHFDTRISSRIWISEAVVKKDEKGLLFTVLNEYAEPKERYRDNENILFSRPNFYGEIADNIGICDVVRLRESVHHVDTENAAEMDSLIANPDRKFPVIVFMAADKEWTEKFDVDYFSYLVCCTGYIIQRKGIRSFAHGQHRHSNGYRYSITVFYPGEAPQTSYKSDILETRFEVIKLEQKKYWNEFVSRIQTPASSRILKRTMAGWKETKQ